MNWLSEAASLVDPPEVRARGLTDRKAEPRPDGVHHDDVGPVQERVVIVLEGIGRSPLRAHVGGDHAAGTHDAHVEPEGRGAGTSVVGEDDWTLPGAPVIGAEVPRVEELSGGLALVTPEDHAPDDGVVLHRLALNGHRVLALPPGRRGLRVGRGVLGGHAR